VFDSVCREKGQGNVFHEVNELAAVHVGLESKDDRGGE
jgi:hypothetical protein